LKSYVLMTTDWFAAMWGGAETKYRLVSMYDQLFSTGMKNKWGKRVYIDLYAGAGYCRIRGTSTILKGSPILALTVQHPFDKYIFCEKDPELLAALGEEDMPRPAWREPAPRSRLPVPVPARALMARGERISVSIVPTASPKN